MGGSAAATVVLRATVDARLGGIRTGDSACSAGVLRVLVRFATVVDETVAVEGRYPACLLALQDTAPVDALVIFAVRRYRARGATRAAIVPIGEQMHVARET